MTSYSWLSATSGNWSTGSDWSPGGGPPTSSDTATIAATGSAYTLSVNSADAAAALTLSSANASLSIYGTAGALTVGGAFTMSAGVLNVATASIASGQLKANGAFSHSGGTINVNNGGAFTLGGTLSQSAGTLNINSGGEISGGVLNETGGTVNLNAGATIANETIKTTGGTFNWNGGTLSGVTYDGTLNLGNASVYITNGFTGAGANGTGAGTINVVDGNLYFDGTQTVSNVTINLGNGTGSVPYLALSGGDETLTLAASTTVVVDTVNYAYLGVQGTDDSIVNQGAINQTGGELDLNPFGYGNGSFTNSGSITAGGTNTNVYGTSFTNTGSLTIDDAFFDQATSFSNQGSITLESAGVLQLDGSVSAANLGTITHSGGSIEVAAGFDNSGFTLNGAHFGQLVLLGGTISGGTATAAGLTFSTNGGTLSGVTYDGPLNLGDDTLHLVNAQVVGSNGTGAGTINIASGNLYFDGTQTVSNVTINLGGGTGSVPTLLLSGGDETLTLAASTTLVVDTVNYAYLGVQGTDDSLVNQGAINQTGGELDLNPFGYGNASFTNSGSITAGGTNTNVYGTSFTNTGSLTIDDAFFDRATSFSNQGSITLESAGVLQLDGSVSAANLGTITHSGGSIEVAASFDNSGFTLNGAHFGQLVLLGGTISGGTATAAGLTFSTNGGTLSGVTYDGPLNLGDDTLHLVNAQVVGSNGTGAGTINIASGNLYFDGTQTVSNVTINLGSGTGSVPTLLLSGGDETLTLAASTTLVVDTVNYAYLGVQGTDDSLVNQGAIDQTGGELYLNPFGYGNASFTNSGSITAGGTNTNVYGTSFTNTGSLTIDDAFFDQATSFSNQGSITLESAGVLQLDGSVSVANLGTITRSGGSIEVAASFDNSGFALNGAHFGQLVLLGGTISGGTATAAGLTFSTNGGTLSGVTYDGPLNLGDDTLHLVNSQVVGTNGTGAGTINIANGELYFDGAQTVSNVTINLGSGTGSVPYLLLSGGDDTLTLAANTTVVVDTVNYAYFGVQGNDDIIVNQGAIDQTGGELDLNPFGYGNTSFTNSGSITAGGTNTYVYGTNFTNTGSVVVDDAFYINTTKFTNSGTIDVANGGSMTVEPTTFTNLPSHALTGGTYKVEAGSSLQVDGFGAINTISADVILSGSGSQFLDYYSGAANPVAIDTTIRTIGATGELQLLAGRNWTTANAAITNSGIINLGGGTLTNTGASASFTDAAGSHLVGYGTVNATTFANSGTIEAKGGTLTLHLSVTGSGASQIDGGADLIVAQGLGGTVNFAGDDATLQINTPASFTASVGGFSLGDTIFLPGVTATGATVNGSNQLVIVNGATTVATLQLTAAYANFSFVAVGVSGGTDIVALPNPATVAQYLAMTADYDLISGGFNISDTASNIAANIGSLLDSHINAITATGGTVTVSAATYLADQSALDKIVGGFAITDTAADISAALNQLGDAKIDAITISDNAAIGVSVAQISSDAAALSKTANQNGNPYQLSVTDTAANVTASLSTLEADVAHISSISLSSGSVAVSDATFQADKTALDKIVGGFAITDTAADIAAALNQLGDAEIEVITISDNAAIGVSVAEISSDATALSKTANQNGNPYQLAVTDTAANVAAALSALEADVAHISSISLSSGTVTVSVATWQTDQSALDKIIGGFTISDTAADISAALNQLSDAGIDAITISDNAALGVSVAEIGSDATALSKLANQNGNPYQLAVTDTAANVTSALSTLELDASHIASITVSSGGPLTGSISTFQADQAALDKILGGFAISDTGADISAALNQLGDAGIDAITISDNAAIGVSVAEISSDATALSKLLNQNGNPYQLSVADTAANVTAALSGLVADVAHISSINLSSGKVTVSAATYLADKSALDKIVGGFAVSDTAADISAALNQLSDAGIDVITIYDNAALGVSVAEISSDATALSKLVNQNGNPYQLAVTDTAANVTSALSTLELDASHIASITVSSGGPLTESISTYQADKAALDKIVGGFLISDSLPNIDSNLAALNGDAHIAGIAATSGTATLSGGLGVNAPSLSLTGTGTLLTVAENLAYAGALSVAKGSTLSVSSGDTLTLTASLTLNGALIGAGKWQQNSGSLTLASGVSLTIASWSSKATAINVQAAVSYGGTFYAGAASLGEAINLSGAGLALSGASTFAGTALAGSHALTNSGTATLSGLTIGGTATFYNTGTAQQSALTTIGDAAGDIADLTNSASGTYDITNDTGIARGPSTASLFTNSGLFEKTGGTGTSSVQADLTSTGTITAATGAIALLGPNNNISGTINGAGTLSFAGGASQIKSGTTVSVAALTATGASTSLIVAENLAYSGAFSDLLGATLYVSSGDTLTLSGATTLAGKISGPGTLAISGGTADIIPYASISGPNVTVTGASTTLALGENLAFTRTFSVGSGATLNLTGGTLTLFGSNSFNDAIVKGSHTLWLSGPSSVTGLTIGGTALLYNANVLTESAGSVTVGDSSGSAATLLNAAAGTYDLLDDSGVGLGSSAASSMSNYGLFEKTGGSGESVIAPKFLNGHNVLDSSGTLDFQAAVTGTGTDTISGAATLEFDSTVASSQKILFQGAGSTLDLTDWGGFSGSLSGFDANGASNDALDVSAPWAFVGFNQSTGMMTFADGGTQHAVKLTGSYIAADFHTQTVGGATQVTYG